MRRFLSIARRSPIAVTTPAPSFLPRFQFRSFGSAAASPAAAAETKKTVYTREFLHALPKADLHVHLDGSIRIDTVLDIAREEKISLPPLPQTPEVPLSSWTADMLRQQIFKPRYTDLLDYLKGFSYTTNVMQSAAGIQRVAYEFALDSIKDNVFYTEVRFAPQLHASVPGLLYDANGAVRAVPGGGAGAASGTGLDVRGVLRAVNAGMAQAAAEHNRSSRVTQDLVPRFEYGLIVCGMRAFDAVNSGSYYRTLCVMAPHLKMKRLAGVASLLLAHEAVYSRDRDGLPIVGIDIAGPESGFPADDHISAFQYAHKHFLRATVHAGEAYGPESIYSALTDLYASRLGHGYQLFPKTPDAVQSLVLPKQQSIAGGGGGGGDADGQTSAGDALVARRKFLSDLVKYIGEAHVAIEVCLTSNLQTLPTLKSLSDHSFGDMLANQLRCCISTDNRLMSSTTVTNELALATTHFSIDPNQLNRLVRDAFKFSFFPGSYTEKMKYIESVSKYYREVEKTHLHSKKQ